ncbi:MAG: glycoside hydrolase family 3 C-terminal domain-containing protein, partial [Clostridia bacterium]|nr:glycoside hydrolase family 3 C-terminal domain-containing protein [Clostridia bacterium]
MALIGLTLVLVLISTQLFKKDLPPNPEKQNRKLAVAQNNLDESYSKAEQFISKLNFNEKLSLMIGADNMVAIRDGGCVGSIAPIQNGNVDFKGMCLQDGPAGVRYAKGTGISWQANINVAATFNKELMYDIGKAQGEENREKGINTFLSPCVNIMRTPQAGRVWEAYGEDPYHSGVCAAQMIKGIQDAGVIATIKHFVGNDQETLRHASSSNIEMGPLMDIYVEPFYRAIFEGNVGSIMAAYNAVNDVYCCENKFLLTDVLRGILGFKGFVMTDWWAISDDRSSYVNSGLDMNMPGGERWGQQFTGIEGSFWRKISEHVQKGEVPEERITESATRIIATMYELNQMDNFPKTQLYKETKTEARKKLQRKAATESQVLLKNEDNILPIKNVKSIAVIGNGAQKRDCGDDNDMLCGSFQNGFIPLGYGSGTTTFDYLVSPIEAITDLAKKNGIDVINAGGLNGREEDINKGAEAAKQADVAIVFVQADSGEEYGNVENSKGDRADLDAWHGGNSLVEAVTKANKNTIVIVNAPATVSVPWLDQVKGLIFAGFPGAESGNGIADVLFGEVNPSGHLPFVWAEMNDYCTQITNGKSQIDYSEGLYVGQRWFNLKNKKPIFPFGYGLTYTAFEYSDLSVSMSSEGLTAEFVVKNVGTVTGSAVPMMFLTFPESIGDYPKYIFKGFEKVELEPGETKNVSIEADDHALSYFNVEANKYVRV